MPNPIPEGHTTVTPYLFIDGAAEAIALYKNAFGAQVQGIMNCPQSQKVLHANLRIGNATIFVSDVMAQGQQTKHANFYLYLEDVDQAFSQARKAGMKEVYPVKDQFWGDRTGTLSDPYGVQWTIATHIKDVAPADIERLSQVMSRNMMRRSNMAVA